MDSTIETKLSIGFANTTKPVQKNQKSMHDGVRSTTTPTFSNIQISFLVCETRVMLMNMSSVCYRRKGWLSPQKIIYEWRNRSDQCIPTPPVRVCSTTEPWYNGEVNSFSRPRCRRCTGLQRPRDAQTPRAIVEPFLPVTFCCQNPE